MGQTAAVIIIGNEVLSGKVRDANSPFLLEQLHSLGVCVRRVEVIPDDIDEIAASVRQASERFDHVFTSGGIGPTHDDLTLPGVARAFDVPLEKNAILARMVREYFGGEVTRAAERLAMLPSGAELTFIPKLAYPVMSMKNVFIFPGVPELLRRKFEGIKERFRQAPYYLVQIFVRDEENRIAGDLQACAARFSGVEVGSYPRFDSSDYSVELTLSGKDPERLRQARSFLLSRLSSDRIVRTVGPEEQKEKSPCTSE